jgi:hypothetical protein
VLYDRPYSKETALATQHCADEAPIQRDELLDTIPAWVSVGSEYALLAAQLSLDSLVLLQSMLTQVAMQSCTKGNERASTGRNFWRARALAHLHQFGVVPEARTADRRMHTVLCTLMGKTDSARFPGVDRRVCPLAYRT